MLLRLGNWVSGYQCRGHSAPARCNSRVYDTTQHCCFARGLKDLKNLWIFRQDFGNIWWSLQRLEWWCWKKPNNLCHVNEVHKVKYYLFPFLDGFGSASLCTRCCSGACRYSILQRKCCHFLLYVIWQLNVLVMKTKNTHCSIIKNNSS